MTWSMETAPELNTCPSNHVLKDDMYSGTEVPIELVKLIVITVYSKTTT